VQHWLTQLATMNSEGVSLSVVTDQDFPTNLASTANPPPLLFVRGTLTPADVRAVAVVGTRKPSSHGIDTAHSIAARLAEQSVTVISGLANGIDAAAHAGALAAHGRTIAVYGCGINTVYPAQNRGLANTIMKSGACVSQFWPQMTPTRWSFPMRNVVTSGLSLATVVVEAGETSGARLQANEALKHGKRVILYRRLVEQQPWAAALLDHPAVSAVDTVDDILALVDIELAYLSDSDLISA
jgi:DNA processing protein